MTQDLSDLLRQSLQDTSRLALLSPFYKDASENTHNYRLSILKERKERLSLGIDDIPKIDRIIAFVDNDWYEVQSDAFKARFPELHANGSAAVVEKVMGVLYAGQNGVELTIARYLIQEQQKEALHALCDHLWRPHSVKNSA